VDGGCKVDGGAAEKKREMGRNKTKNKKKDIACWHDTKQ